MYNACQGWMLSFWAGSENFHWWMLWDPCPHLPRITTKGKKTIKYGKVEVVAKLPKGDWLWPAIWMMPEDSVYGVWPRSGEIDIVESRGNAAGYPNGGRDTYTSTLHWGLSSNNDGFWRTTDGKALRRSDFSEGYHTFGLEWPENYLFTYLDFKLQQVLYLAFKGQKNLWQRGDFSTQSENNTLLVDPWRGSGDLNAPFDQSFYLILNVAVGSRNGWFPDGIGNKPWVDAGDTSALDFWNAANAWLPM
ncbi:Concanavalin A-like lectin/glucanase domain containing protein [Hyaloscypha variabilis]